MSTTFSPAEIFQSNPLYDRANGTVTSTSPLVISNIDTVHKESVGALVRITEPATNVIDSPWGGHDMTFEVVGALVRMVGCNVGPIVSGLVGERVGHLLGAKVVF